MTTAVLGQAIYGQTAFGNTTIGTGGGGTANATAAICGQAIYGQAIYVSYTGTGGGTPAPVLGATSWQFGADPTGPRRMHRASTQRIRIMVRALTAGNPVDPTAGAVHFAFTAPGTGTGTAPTGAVYSQAVYGQASYATAATVWVPGTWETLTGPPRQYGARVLVGPGQTADLGRGFWIVWIRVTDSPESPVRAVSTLTIT